MTIVSTALLGVMGVLGIVIVAEGAKKFTGAHTDDFDRFGYPQWFRLATGGFEFLGGICLLAGLVVGSTVALVGGLAVSAVLVGAVATHIRVGDSASSMAPAVILLILALGVVAYHIELIV